MAIRKFKNDTCGSHCVALDPPRALGHNLTPSPSRWKDGSTERVKDTPIATYVVNGELASGLTILWLKTLFVMPFKVMDPGGGKAGCSGSA